MGSLEPMGAVTLISIRHIHIHHLTPHPLSISPTAICRRGPTAATTAGAPPPPPRPDCARRRRRRRGPTPPPGTGCAATAGGGSVSGLLPARRRHRSVAGPLPAWRRSRRAPTGPAGAPTGGGSFARLRPAWRGPQPVVAPFLGSDRPDGGANRWRLRRRARTDDGSVSGLLQASCRRRPVAGPLPAWQRRRRAPTGHAKARTSGGSVAGPEQVAAPSPGSY